MLRTLSLFVVFAGILPLSSTAEEVSRKYRAEPVLLVATYPVADLVLPLGERRAPEFSALERHLRDFIGPEEWPETRSVHIHNATFSLVIRQTESVHNRIAEELNRLRRELDLQVSVAIRVISGPRNAIAELADAFPGELGRWETEELLKLAQASQRLNIVNSPKITLFSRQTVNVLHDGRSLELNATVANGGRSVLLKMSEHAELSSDVLGNLAVRDIHSGRSAAIRFEAPVSGSVIPPAADAVERLVVVTPLVLVREDAAVAATPAR